MSTPDEKFLEQLRATFQVEAQEHLQGISTMLLDLENPGSGVVVSSTIEAIYRAAHSLKGAARSVGLQEIESICQAMEGVFHGWKSGRSTPSPKAFDTLHHAVDAIRGLMTEPGGKNTGKFEELVHRLERIRLNGPSGRTAAPSLSSSDTARAAGQTMRIEAQTPAPPIERVETLLPTPAGPTPKIETAHTVRVALEKLDERLLAAEDMLTIKTMTSQQLLDLREIMARFERWRAEWAEVSMEVRAQRQAIEQRATPNGKKVATNGNGKGSKEAWEEEHAERGMKGTQTSASLIRFVEWNHHFVRALEDRLASITTQASNNGHQIARRVDDLLQDSKKMLMLPFQTLADSFPLLVRDLCRDQHKEAQLLIKGGDIQVDKRILEEMKDAFIHLLRNSVDHGLETPERRELAGKPRMATISINVSQIRSDRVGIVVSDDGGGVNVESLKNAAVKLGVVSDLEVKEMSHADALGLMFRSGVSTSQMITAISGRGLGMAIVHAKLEKLGGKIVVESTAGAGTVFRMELPLTLATFRGILVRAGDLIYLVPTAHLERVTRVKVKDIMSVENRQSILFDGRPISLVRLQSVLGGGAGTLGDDSTSLPVAVLQLAEQRIAFLIDEVLHEEEVLVKPLPRPLVRVRHVAGATILGSGRVVAVLNVAELMESARQGGAPVLVGNGEVASPAAKKRVLVVEDSITSRMLLKGILEGAGFKVRIAVDGVDAFMIMREELFDLVVSDVEMPRMNGLDLTKRIRSEKHLADLPVVLVTALESRDERERGIDAGANAYIVKSSFDQSNLLEVVQRLV